MGDVLMRDPREINDYPYGISAWKPGHGRNQRPFSGDDVIERPSHYYEGRHIQPFDVIDDWGLDFYLGNAVKYFARCYRKGDPLENLKKARRCLDHKIERLKREQNGRG